jgi:hypothetical protein
MAEQIYNEAMCEEAKQLLAAGKSIARVATNLGVCRETIYEWCEKHPEFARAFKQGKDAAQAYWEDLGEEGARGEIKNFSAPTWIFTVKNRFREDYKEEKQDQNSVGAVVDKLLDRLVE